MVSKGFTLIEMVIVITIISILAVVALPRMMDTHDNAHEASVSGVGGALASAVIMVRSQWVANADTIEVDGVEGYGNDNIAVSSDGWPTDAGQGAGSNHSPVMASAQRCLRLWNALLASNSPKASTSLATGADYLVDTVNGNCRYTYQRTSNGSNIVYNARTGEVVTSL